MIKRGLFLGTLILVIFFCPSGRSRGGGVLVPPPVISVPALVMKALEPFMCQKPFCSTARVCVPPESEPASGSVKPKDHNCSPLARGARKRSFCSALP